MVVVQGNQIVKKTAGNHTGFFMVECVEIIFQSLSEQSRDLLIANLPEMGFHGMEETEVGLIAYADVNEFNHAEFEQLCIEHTLVFSQQIVKQQNWNALWESNFDPVFIPGQVHVRAHFHPQVEGFTHEILITPKMSFGTGHHATTRMMMTAMLDIDFTHHYILDFGTGTGILSILAEKLGAVSIQAIDNDTWSIENVAENLKMNDASRCSVFLGETLDELGNADIILANINKSVLIQHAVSIYNHLNTPGKLLISGLLQVDYDDICGVFTPLFGVPIKRLDDTGWIALLFEKRF